MGVWILSVNNQDVALSSTDDSCSWLRPLWLWTDQFWSGLPVQVDKIYFLFVYCLTFVFFLWLNFNCFWLDEWCHVPVIGPVVWLGVGGACHLAQVKQVHQLLLQTRWTQNCFISAVCVCVCVLSSEGIEPLTKQRPPLRPKGETCLFYYIFAISISELNWSYHVANC